MNQDSPEVYFSQMRYMLLVLLACPWHAQARMVHLIGTISNWREIGIRTEYHGVNVQGVGDAMALGIQVDAETGRFDGELDIPVVRAAGRQWMDIHLVTVCMFNAGFRTMTIRVPASREVDLGTFDWKPSHYRSKNGAFVIDTAVPRDTVIGGIHGNHIRISPINPTSEDTMRFEFLWENSGQPDVASMGGFYMKDCCTMLSDFTFAVRTDTDVFGESWLHRVERHLVPRLEPGRYRLRQVPATGEHLRDVDFLLNKDLYFTVGERREP